MILICQRTVSTDTCLWSAIAEARWSARRCSRTARCVSPQGSPAPGRKIETLRRPSGTTSPPPCSGCGKCSQLLARISSVLPLSRPKKSRFSPAASSLKTRKFPREPVCILRVESLGWISSKLLSEYEIFQLGTARFERIPLSYPIGIYEVLIRLSF